MICGLFVLLIIVDVSSNHVESSLLLVCSMRSKREVLAQRMMDSTSLRGNGLEDVTSFWLLKGMDLNLIGFSE